MADTTIVTGQGEPSRLFGPALDTAIAQAVARIPSDKRGNVELRITLQGIEAEAAIRLFAGANTSVFFQRRTDGQRMAGARVGWSF